MINKLLLKCPKIFPCTFIKNASLTFREAFRIFWRACTCKVQASERNEVLDIVISQFHHDQADQKPAT